MLSPIEEESSLRICPLLSNVQIPNPSAPQLLEITVMWLTPLHNNPAIKCSGFPDNPNPPDMIVMPSKSRPLRAASAVENILRFTDDSHIGPITGQNRQ